MLCNDFMCFPQRHLFQDLLFWGAMCLKKSPMKRDANLSPLSSFILTWKGEPKNSWRASLMLHLPEWPHIPSPAHPPCISWSKFRRPVTTFIKEILDKPIGADHFCFLQWAILPWLDYLLFWALVWFKMYYQSIIFTKKYKKESPSASALQHHLKEFLIARGGRTPIILIGRALLCKMEKIVNVYNLLYGIVQTDWEWKLRIQQSLSWI